MKLSSCVLDSKFENLVVTVRLRYTLVQVDFKSFVGLFWLGARLS